MKSNKVVQLTPREQIRDEASVWVARLDRGLSEEELAELKHWLAQGDSHREQLFELAAVWDDFCVLNQLSSLVPFDPRAVTEQQTARAWLKPAFGMAAALALALTVFLGGQWTSPEHANPDQTVAKVADPVSKKSTRVGENRLVFLPDGSSAHLNTDSELEINYTDTQRALRLIRGEARFSVIHDPTRPFVVEVGANTVQALGTIFNVQYLDSEVEVIVTEGSVRVAGGRAQADDSITMVSGQRVQISRDTVLPAEQLPLEHVQRELAWRDGMLVFRGESLQTAISEVSRYTETSIQVEGAEVQSLKIAGYYKADDIEGLLLSLKENFPLTYQRQGDEIIISGTK